MLTVKHVLENTWLSPKHFARKVDYDTDYIRTLCRQGRIRHRRLPNGRIRIPESEVDAFLGPKIRLEDLPYPRTDEERYSNAKLIAQTL